MKIRKTQGEYPLDIVVLDETVHFDEDGVTEVNEFVSEVLLAIPGYEEYKGKSKREATPPADNSKGKKEDGKGKQNPPSADQNPTAPPSTKE
ncbi:hypothetical protein [Paenibacillus graminis]|uniref:hypothetical protein n=1 Tax=Paenibacillus graminis TaxID=189425 RepID=UPI002DBBA421|nr:hypothetical protein [Paenibacillus graminis]MEC0169908.1 hypothetical protein [Paenibacillus graminis]